MPFRSDTPSSSPDPLSAATAPSIAEAPRRSQLPAKRRFPSPTKTHSTSKVNIHSPSKMTATSNSVLSPWRIKVVVQAERNDGEEGTPSGRGKNRRTPPNFTLEFPSAGSDEEDGDNDLAMLPQALKTRVKRGRSTSVVKTRTTTVKVPVKGLSSSPERVAADGEAPIGRGRTATAKRPATPIAPRRRSPSKPRTARSMGERTPKKVAMLKPAATPKPAAAPKRKRTPAKKNLEAEDGKTLEAVSEGVDEDMAEARPAPPTITKKTPRRKSGAHPLVVPTLATTRSRRSLIAPPSSALGSPNSLSLPKRTTRAPSVESNVSATRSVTPRRALSGMDPNLLLSPTPTKFSPAMLSPDGNKPSRLSPHQSITPSRSPKRTGKDKSFVSQSSSIGEQELDSFVVSEGGSMSLPDFQTSSPFPPSLNYSGDISGDFGDLLEQDEDMSEEEALADVTTAGSVWEAQAECRDYDFTYISAGISHTPRVRRNAPSPQVGSPLFRDDPVGVETFYGVDGADGDEDEAEDEVMKSSVLPEFTEPVEAAYTPHKQKNSAVFSTSVKPRDKGKGKAVESASKGKIALEKLSESAGSLKPKDLSLCPSSPPFRVVIHSPAKSLTTPYKRSHDAEIPDAPASRRLADRETPSLTLVREASEVMSDALEIDEAMTMVEQQFGHGFEGPPTPKSREHSSPPPPPADEEMEEPVSYLPGAPKINVQSEADTSYPSLNTTGIPSPPTSQHPDRSPPTKTPEQIPVSLEVQTPSGGESYFARIFSPLKFRASSRTAMPASKTQAPAPTSWTPNGSAKTPNTTRSVLFTAEPSAAVNRTAALEAEWAREREENVKKAQEVGAITVSDTTIELQPTLAAGDRTKTLLAEWERERSMARRQAKEADVVTISDTEEEESYSVLDQDTAAFEESLARHIESKERGVLASSSFVARGETTVTKSRINTRIFATSIASSRSSPPPSAVPSYASTDNYATTREQAYIHTTTTTTPTTHAAAAATSTFSEDDEEAAGNNILPDSLLDALSQPTVVSSSGLLWTKENYRHLSAILSSRSTDPKSAKTRYSVQLDRPERLLANEVVAALDLDNKMYLRLTLKECAAVERFLRREKVKGAGWDVTEVVRRTAGLRVAAVRRELTGKQIRQ